MSSQSTDRSLKKQKYQDKKATTAFNVARHSVFRDVIEIIAALQTIRIQDVNATENIDLLYKRFEIIRENLRCGRFYGVDAALFRCSLFYYDMSILAKDLVLPNHGTINHMIENYRSSAAAMRQYHEATTDRDTCERFAHVLVFGLIQSLTQIMDTTEGIYNIIGLDSGKRFKSIKQREYWKFRTRHTHIITRKPVRSFGDPQGLDIHIFIEEGTNAYNLKYYSIGEQGFMVRTAVLARFFEELQFDLTPVFEEILVHCRKVGKAQRSVIVRGGE